MVNSTALRGGLRTRGIVKSSRPDEPLITVVTTVLNGAKHIEQAIQSVLAQSYRNTEYLVIDGGSTDGTVEILRKYERSIDLWISEPDKGSSDAGRKGIGLARGEWISFLNGDDWYEIETVEEVSKAIMREKEIGLIYGQVRYIHNEKPLYVKLQLEPSALAKDLAEVIEILLPGCFFRASCFERFGVFDGGVRIANDGDMLVRLFVSGVKFCYVDRVLTNMRTGGRGEVNFREARKEIRRILTNAGYPRHKAFLWALGKNLKQHISSRIGLDHPVCQFYRSFSSRKNLEKSK